MDLHLRATGLRAVTKCALILVRRRGFTRENVEAYICTAADRRAFSAHSSWSAAFRQTTSCTVSAAQGRRAVVEVPAHLWARTGADAAQMCDCVEETHEAVKEGGTVYGWCAGLGRCQCADKQCTWYHNHDLCN